MSTDLTNYKNAQLTSLQEKIIVKEALVDIAADDDLSNAVDCRGYSLVGIRTPGTLTSTAITFQVAHDADGTYLTAKDTAGADYSVTVAASGHYNIPAADTISWQFVKIATGSAESEDRTIELLLKPIN